jgi:hypothetical protein
MGRRRWMGLVREHSAGRRGFAAPPGFGDRLWAVVLGMIAGERCGGAD